MATKNDLNQFSDFFENVFGSNGRNCRFGTEDRYWVFWNFHYKVFDEKTFWDWFHMSKAWGSTTRKQKNIIIIIIIINVSTGS